MPRSRWNGRRPLVWLYVLAWVPYLVAYGAVLQAALGIPTRYAVIGAVSNGLPPALLGWWAIGVGRSASAVSERMRFWTVHGAAGASYAGLSMVGTAILFAVYRRLEDGVWSWTAESFRPVFWQLLICGLLYVVLAGLGHSLNLRDRLHEEKARAARSRELAATSQLEALRARLDPHFLFNTLHSLLALVRRDPTAAEEGLERLGGLLHYALRARNPEGDMVTLAEEREFVLGYVELERLRLGERLRWTETIERDAWSCCLPAFTLQPLVENAIRHAVAPRADGGSVRVSGAMDDGCLSVEVIDDGPGAAPGDVEAGGLGLTLVRERLRAIYGADASLDIDTAPGAGFRARVRVPLEFPNEASLA